MFKKLETFIYDGETDDSQLIRAFLTGVDTLHTLKRLSCPIGITSDVVTISTKLPSLTNLHIYARRPLESRLHINLNSVGQLQHLQSLSLRFVLFGDLQFLAQLKQLSTFDAQWCNLNDGACIAIAQLAPKLTELGIRGNHYITDSGFLVLGRALTQLQSLDVKYLNVQWIQHLRDPQVFPRLRKWYYNYSLSPGPAIQRSTVVVVCEWVDLCSWQNTH